MSWSKSVFSSMATEIAYDSNTQEMIVTWAKSGKRTAYQGVPEDVASACANAASVGQYINSQIKGAYSYRYV